MIPSSLWREEPSSPEFARALKKAPVRTAGDPCAWVCQLALGIPSPREFESSWLRVPGANPGVGSGDPLCTRTDREWGPARAMRRKYAEFRPESAIRLARPGRRLR